MQWFIAVGTLIAAIAGIGACWFGFKGSKATERQANVEADRWHAEIAPVFTARCRLIGVDNMDAELTVLFAESSGLDRVELTVSIRDDDTDRLYRVAPDLTAEQIKAQVWGPYRFVPDVDGADKNGRGLAPFTLARGEGRRFRLQRTWAPPWAGDNPHWWDQWADHPVRLTLVARSDGQEPWTSPLDVKVDRNDA